MTKPKTQPRTTKPLDRNAIRAQIFGSGKPKTKVIEFFGAEVELRQPTTRRILELRKLDIDNPGRAAAEMIVNYVFVPGTDELVFETADVDNILDMPFGEDMSRMNGAITELTNIDVKAATKN